MEAVQQVQREFQNSTYNDLSDQPWFVRWGICILGLLAAVILIFTSLRGFGREQKNFEKKWNFFFVFFFKKIFPTYPPPTDIFTFDIVGIIELALAIILICFEVTQLAKAFNFTWCGYLIKFSELASPLLRSVIYGGTSIPIICFKGVKAVFILLPCIATGAAYFVLWMDSRKQGDEAPIAEGDFGGDDNEFA